MADADRVARPELADLTARAAARAVASGDATAADLVAACIARIDASDDTLRAWSHVDRQGAMETAKKLDDHRRRGLPLGPLHGVPVGVKDIVDVAGMPGENGAEADRGRAPREDAEVVKRLRRAGAVILGKTATTPLAQGSPPAPTANPHDAARTPGGSSAGSAAAVAAGMVPLAVGTQTNGSVIRPSAFCGVVGFKPSYGSIPRTGILPVAPSLDHVGLMGRAVEDMALAGLLMGEDGVDPDCRGFRGPLAEVAASRPPVTPAFAFIAGPGGDRAETSTREAFAELCAAIGEAGPVIDTLPLPASFNDVFALTRRLMAVEGAHHLGRYLDRAPETVGDDLRALIEEGRATSAPDYLAARERQAALSRDIAGLFEDYDAIVTPATPGEAPGRDVTGDPSFCTLWSFTGLPSITLPLMTGPSGLPLGVQIVGAPGDDARLLRTAQWLVDTLTASGDST